MTVPPNTWKLLVQVDGKFCHWVSIYPDDSEQDIIERAKDLVPVIDTLDGRKIIKTVIVDGRLVNFLTEPDM